MFKHYLSTILIIQFFGVSLFAQAPAINSLSSWQAAPGSNLSINGSGFHTSPDSNIVHFGAVRAVVSSSSSTMLNVEVPVSATYDAVSVIVPSGHSAFSHRPFMLQNCASEVDSLAFGNRLDLEAGTGVYSVAYGDLNGDSLIDAVVCNYLASTVSVYQNTSTPNAISFAVKMDYFTNLQPTYVILFDIDGDGKKDIVTSNYGGGDVSILRNNVTSLSFGTSSFSTAINLTAAPQGTPIAVSAGDLDLDGKPEIIIADHVNDRISIWPNLTSPGNISASDFGTRIDLPCGILPIAVLIFDIDGDGKKDLAISNFISNTIDLRKNNSTTGNLTAGSFGASALINTGIGPSLIAAGDLNGDQKEELIVPEYGANTLSIFQNTSSIGIIDSASFASPVVLSIAGGPNSAALNDLDHDGRPDLVLALYDTGQVATLRNIGTGGSISAGSFSQAYRFNGGIYMLQAGAADFNNDTLADVVSVTFADTAMTVHQNLLNPQPVITTSGGSAFCTGDSMMLNVNPASSILWNTGYNGASFSTDTGGLFTVTHTHATGCTRTSSIFITENVFEPVAFFESNGTVSSTIPVATHESNGGFDRLDFHFSGTATVRSTSASTGYINASGGANIYFPATVGTTFLIDSINVAGWGNLNMSFGLYKASTSGDGSDFQVEVSADGTNFFPLIFAPLPTGSGTTGWYLLNATGTIPAAQNLTIRFVQNGTVSAYRIDDVKLFASPGTAQIFRSANYPACAGDTIILSTTVSGIYHWNTGDSTSSIAAVSDGIYSVFVSDSNGCGATAWDTINFNSLPVIQHSDLDDLCLSDSVLALSGGTPSGGSYSGPGVIAASFDPMLAGAGMHILTYTFFDQNGCGDSITVPIEVHNLPLVSWLMDSNFCVESFEVLLTGGLPAGGMYSGAFTVDSIFSPSQAGIGNFTLTYAYVDSNGCADSTHKIIWVEVCGGLMEHELAEWQLFPNPAGDHVSFRIVEKLPAGSQIHLLDISGKIQRTFVVNQSEEQLDLRGIPAGTYMVNLISGNQQSRKILIKVD